ncbi:violaxanthin de-epoxidase, chloroplastic [Amborella trichopoda]|uniref:VDE lipocalin domain-containing protein n=1 Tax=Amborella trichopoda TaxID=13333 RepID=W1P8D0_AMBTC|nr:violaxanthin de-epoxidase, chloroplastic [Amborella trichopoda]ERN03861.1 hypothetical protein AMTR_s00078p00158650 [Amborella trichopoda]|eukprot:XP_006842186.1 violaxanthin de-epoxidase, chloroplastic [Amborella trichopoda]
MLLNSAYPSLKPPQQNHFWFHIPKTAVPKTTSLSLPSPTKTNTQNRFPQQTLAVSATQQNHSVTVVSIVGDGSFSPIKSTPWEQVMLHTADRLKWVDEGYEMLVFTDKLLTCKDQESNNSDINKALLQANILVIVGIQNQASIDWLLKNTKTIPNVVCFDSFPLLTNKLGGLQVPSTVAGNLAEKIAGKFLNGRSNEAIDTAKTISKAWNRYNSDDIRFVILVIINGYVRPVPILQGLRAKGFSTLKCMAKNCRAEILGCLLDSNCRKALQCLNTCDPTDQVCSYMCIASYESPKLEAFSLCALQKHNCLDLSAEIPEKPIVFPLREFRGEKLSHEVAEDLFVGCLGSFEWSWRVAAGQNPAYDQFPCQYQLFYRGKARGSFWYEPVFQVRTLDGEMVWRRRRYRVRRGDTPGTFFFSVSDNGVVSKEFWTIIDVCDDLRWGLFHYKGAAQASGQSYIGAVLVTPDGRYPSENGGQRLANALERCYVKEWELYNVDNGCCPLPPLGLPQGSSLHQKLNPAFSGS